MAKTLTAANSVILITIPGLYDIPQQLQGFATDDVFSSETVNPAETMMGVDGKLSAGWVPAEVKQTYNLQGDSDSIEIFEDWYAAQQTARELYRASGLASVTSVERKYTMRRGVLTGYSPTPSVKKVIQPRVFEITWEAVLPGVA